MSKVMYFDTETTGTNPQTCAVIQIAALIEIDGVEAERFELKFAAHPNAEIDLDALHVTGVNFDEVCSGTSSRPTFKQGYLRFLELLDEHVDKFDKTDKLIPVAYNGGFDIAMLSALAERCGDKYLGSYIDRKLLVDPLAVLRWYAFTGVELPQFESYKLGDVCKAFGIELTEAHDAVADTVALRELTKKLIPPQRELAQIGLFESALTYIANIGGNLPDERLLSVNGVNDGKDRALKVVAARQVAQHALRIKPLGISPELLDEQLLPPVETLAKEAFGVPPSALGEDQAETATQALSSPQEAGQQRESSTLSASDTDQSDNTALGSQTLPKRAGDAPA